MLLIGFQLILVVCCAICVYAAYRHVSDAISVAHDLRTSRSRILANEAALEALTLQLQKVRGSFFAFKAKVEDEMPEPVDADYSQIQTAPPHEAVQHFPRCENYAKAQIDGPQSAAAKCECGYCSGMRAVRDSVRRALIPKTATAQAQHARQASGQE